MGRSYWIIEYLKVAAAYGFTMYVWPLVVFREHFRKKSITYRFIFCTLVMMNLITTVITLMGIFNILYTPLLIVIFHGTFIVRLLQFYNPFPKIRHTLHCFQHKTLTLKRLFLNMFLGLCDGVKELAVMIWNIGKGNRLEYTLLFIGLLYGTIYFSYTPLTVHNFATSDQYVHQSWAYFLSQGTIYSKGIYPVGMHCMMYIFSFFFGVSLYNTNIFVSAIHIHAILISAYLMLKEFYSFKYSAMFGLFAFLTVGVPTGIGIGAISRMTMTLPQEYAFTAVFLSAYGLLRFMKRKEKAAARQKNRLADRRNRRLAARQESEPAEQIDERLAVGQESEPAGQIDDRPVTRRKKRLAGRRDSRLTTRQKVIKSVATVLKTVKKNVRTVLSDADLLFFLLSVSYTIMVHYYATIMAFLICITVFIAYFPLNLQWSKLSRLILATVLALFLAAAPTGIALAKGYKFQGSIAWALSVSKGEKYEITGEEGQYDVTARNNNTSKNESTGNNQSSNKGLLTRTIDAAIAAPTLIKEKLAEYDQKTFQTLYQGVRGTVMRIVCITIAMVSLAAGLLQLILKRLARLLSAGGSPGKSRDGMLEYSADGDADNDKDNSLEEKLGTSPADHPANNSRKPRFMRFFLEEGASIGKLNMRSFTGHFAAAFALLVFMTAFSPKTIGFPRLIAGDRLCALIELVAVMTYCCLPDFVFSIMDGKVPDRIITIAVPVTCFGIYIGMLFSGLYHGFTYNGMTRYPMTVDLTERITKHVPKQKFTIVSPTDELYQLIDYGYHEEMVDFILAKSDKTYTIPTPYIFVFLEKKPLQYGQILFPDGPKWLGGDNYLKVFNYDNGGCTIYPSYKHGEVTEETAAKELPPVKLRSDYAMQLPYREIMQSQAMQWYESFSSAYPNDGTVVYEDDYLLCYCIKQNEFSLFTLGVVD